MTQAKTTLVLGAGASASSGFPVGLALRHEMLDWLSGDLSAIAERLSVPPSDLSAFLSQFRYAQTYSIDAFLARREIFAEIGKRAIVALLLQHENSIHLFNERKDDHWYQYLVNRLTVHDWDSLDLSWLSVVTFNYDRSLECFLCVALQSIYGKSETDVLTKLNALRIVHVYGGIGLPWEDRVGFPYQPPVNDDYARLIRFAAGRLRVIPEGRNDDPSVQEARELIRTADKVCFLGFSYDAANLERLGVPETLAGFEGNSARYLGGTSVGITSAQFDRAGSQMFGREWRRTGYWTERFRDCKCLPYLEQTLVLG